MRRNRRAPRHLKRGGRKAGILRVCIFLAALAFFICAAAWIIPQLRMKREQLLFSRLAAQLASVPEEPGAWISGQDDSDADSPGAIDNPSPHEQETPGLTEEALLEAYRSLAEQNPDMAGWVSIAGTDLNYPVMYTPLDGEYYLRRDFNKKVSYSGTPFLDARCDMGSASLFVHGHNLENGTMFELLLQYQAADYWQAHPKIRFDSLAEIREYTVLGAFFTQIDQAHFPYYNYCGALDSAQFSEYIRQVQQLSLYDTQLGAQFGDQLLTLSTCSYHAENGRFVLVAKRTA